MKITVAITLIFLAGCNGFFTEPIAPRDRLMTLAERQAHNSYSIPMLAKVECIFAEGGIKTNEPCRDLRATSKVQPLQRDLAVEPTSLPIRTEWQSTVSEVEVLCARLTGSIWKDKPGDGHYPQSCSGREIHDSKVVYTIYAVYGHDAAWNHEARHLLWGRCYHGNWYAEDDGWQCEYAEQFKQRWGIK